MRCIADVMEIDTGADFRAMTTAQATTWGGGKTVLNGKKRVLSACHNFTR